MRGRLPYGGSQSFYGCQLMKALSGYVGEVTDRPGQTFFQIDLG